MTSLLWFGLESDEGFYGGEDDEDGEVFIDITEDETVEEIPETVEDNQEKTPETISKEEKIENDTKAAQKDGRRYKRNIKVHAC